MDEVRVCVFKKNLTSEIIVAPPLRTFASLTSLLTMLSSSLIMTSAVFSAFGSDQKSSKVPVCLTTREFTKMKDNAILPAPKRGVAKIAARFSRQHFLLRLTTLIFLPTALYYTLIFVS